MPASIPALIDDIAEAAAVLEDPAAQPSLDVLRTHSGTARLQILIAGSTGSGRASLANLLLDRPGLIPVTPIPKAALSITARHGETTSVEAVSLEGVKTSMPPERLRSFLTSPATPGRYTSVEMRARSELLETCDLRIEAVETERSDIEWRDLLAGIDYVLLVLNANALLSELERRFVREHLSEGFGLHRVAIVINGIDQVPEEERESIVELVRHFLGPFESQPALIPMSALEAASDSAEGGYDDLMTLADDLLERHAPLRAATVRRGLEAALQDLQDTAARRYALFSLDAEEAARLRETIASRREWLRGRIERAQHRVDAFVDTILKERLLREIEGFADAFRHRLPDEVRSVQDITTVKKYLPGYMETVWKDFLHSQMIAVRAGLLDEARRIEELVEGDLEELVGSSAPGLRGAIGGFDSGAHAMHIFVMPKRGKHRATGFVKSLSLFGMGAFVGSPILGALSFGASMLVRRIFKQGMEDADREAIVAAAQTASRDLERELTGRIAKQFEALVTEVKTGVADLYKEGIERIETVLDESAGSSETLGSRRVALDTLIHTTIPELRARVAQLEEPVPA